MAQQIKPSPWEEFVQGLRDSLNESLENLRNTINQAVTSYRDYVISRIQDFRNLIFGVLDRLEGKRTSLVFKLADLGVSYGETSAKSSGSIELSIITLAAR